MYQKVGGPLDGWQYNKEVDPEKPCLIFSLSDFGMGNDLFAMYKLESDKLIYVETKTKQQLMEYGTP